MNINNFNKLCDKLGYKDVVPDEVVQAFDEKCAEIEKDVTRRQLEAIEEYEALGQERKKAAADEIQEWSW